MGRETSVAMRNMPGLSQNREAIEVEARKSALIRLFGLVSSLNRRSAAPEIPLLTAIEKIAEFFTPGKTLILYRNRNELDEAIRCVLRIRILWKSIQTPADEKRRSRLETMAAAEYDPPDDSALGEVTEWPIVLVSKTSVPARVPRVRIPASPLISSLASGDDTE